MKKLALLSFSLFASIAGVFSADMFDNAYWIIKDGKMTDNISVLHYDDEDIKFPDVLVETTKDGVDAVEFQHISQDWLDPRLLFNPNNLPNLNTHYILMMEYMIPASHADTAIAQGNKPLFIIGLSPDIDGMDKNAPHSDITVYIDAKWGPTEQWRTVYKYIYANPAYTTLSGMIFSYAREYQMGNLTEFAHIRNLCLVPSENNVKPFYAENFTNYGIGEFYGEMHYLRHPSAKKEPKITAFNGGIKPTITEKDGSSVYLRSFRDFIDDKLRNTDGSGYLDCEILQALRIESEQTRDSVVFEGIQIPAGTSQIFSEMLIKKYKNEDEASIDADYSTVANVDMPIKFKFNTGEVVDVAKDTMKLIWTKYKGVVDVPAGATSVDLIFCPMAVGYLVDEIILSSAEFNDVKDFMAKHNNFEVIAYVDDNGNIIVLNGELQAIYNLNGRIASEKDKAVVILVKNEEGKTASKLMIRK